MTFFRQLKLLLWKNWLTIIRQPLWSLTLIIWPLIIFIIIAVTRTQFPPIVKDTCYVGPRNLPSTGFFPFLQTLMCNTDSNCHDKPRVKSPMASHSSRSGHGRSSPGNSSLLAQVFERDFGFSLPKDADDPAPVIELLNKILGSSHQAKSNNASFMYANTNQSLGDQEALQEMLESLHVLKRSICGIALPMVNATSRSPLSYTVVTFCTSNNTVFETTLQTINQVLTELMLTQPEEMATMAGMSMLVFDQLQNETSLWESLLALPELLSSGSVDQMQNLLTNLQSALFVIENSFPQVSDSLSYAHQVLAGGINLFNYVQNWPGKNVSISLGDVVTLHNDSLSDMLRALLQVQIPLDKTFVSFTNLANTEGSESHALALALDKEMVRQYLCENSSSSLLLMGACNTGVMDMLLGWISPELVAKQTLLAWSKDVALHDVAIARGLLQNLMGWFPSSEGHGGPNKTRTRRSVDVQPQNIEEELFLEVGKVLMEIVKMVPELNTVLQDILRAGFQSMEFATLTLQTVNDTVTKMLADADQLQQTYLTLLTNPTQSSIWMTHVLDSVMEVINKSLTSGPLTCEETLDPFEWLLSTESIKIEVWKSAICQNGSLEQALLMEWWPVVQKAKEFVSIFTGKADQNVTLPMILYEWHKVSNTSLQFAELLTRSLPEKLGGAYWNNWNVNSSQVLLTLQQSLSLSIVNFGRRFETTQLWPQAQIYFDLTDWILSYRPGVTTLPNCTINIMTETISCKNGSTFNWPEFAQTVTDTVMSPIQDVIVNCIKGTTYFLQKTFGSSYKYLLGNALAQDTLVQDPLANYLIKLLNELDDFVNEISQMTDENITNPAVMFPLIHQLLESTGLQPLRPLFLGDGQPNVSTIIDVAVKIGRLNQNIFAFNESDPTMPQLERLILRFFSLESNLTMSLSHIMGHSLLTYSEYFHPEYVAKLREMLKPFTQKTSTGLVEAILRAMELLKTVLDSPNGDPTGIILGYVRQVQDFVMSLYRLQRVQQVSLPSGQLSAAQVTDLHVITKEFLALLTPEGLHNLTQAGPDAAQNIIIQRFVAFLPSEVQDEARRFLQHLKDLQAQVTECTDGQKCLAGISEVFTLLDKILNMTLSANGSVSINIVEGNSILTSQKDKEVASIFFSLLLSPADAALVKTFQQTLHFIRLLIATPNITVSDVQGALMKSNLTLEQLNHIAALAGAANVNNLILNIMEIISVQECFGPQHNASVTSQCVHGLISGVTGFLANIPALRNHTTILSLIPKVMNSTIGQVIPINPRAEPTEALTHILNTTLANVILSLQQSHLSTPEIMTEIRMLQSLIEIFPSPALLTNTSSDSMLAQKQYLELIEWYLEKLTHITSNSSVSMLLQPFLQLTQMQVTLQLAQTNFSIYVSNKIENLIKNLTYPIDGEGVRKIGLASVEIFRGLFEVIMYNFEAQNNTQHHMPFLNTTVLNAIRYQVMVYVAQIENWMKQPKIPLVFMSMLQWGNASINISTPVEDLHHLVQSLGPFLSDDQLDYLYITGNITQSLSEALMVAEQPGGLQSDHFISAILKAVQTALQILSRGQRTLPLPVEKSILQIVQESLKLIFQPSMNFALSRNITLHILKNAEYVIREMVPDMAAQYILPGINVVTTYFETAQIASGPDNWNLIILEEMRTIRSLLPANSSAHHYISVLINTTHVILQSGQGNMSLWQMFENASVENLPGIFGQIGRLLSTIWPLLTDVPLSPPSGPSLMTFAHLGSVLQQLFIGEADQDTWNNLEKMIAALLSTIRETEVWDTMPSVIQLIENITGSIVKVTQAENAMILSLQKPVLNLMAEIAKTVNTTNVNMTEVVEGMQLAIKDTLQAAQQANGTLKCSDVLLAWEPVREVAGFSHAAVSVWCNVSVQPVLDAYSEAIAYATHLNMSHTGVGPMTLNATAARIVNAIQSVYQAGTNQALVTYQLVMTVYNQTSQLLGQRLRTEAYLHWSSPFLYEPLRNPFFEAAADEILKVSPSLLPYIKAVKKAMSHIQANSHLLKNNTSSDMLCSEAAMIFLSSLNITSGDMYSMMWGNFSGLNVPYIVGMINDTIELMIDLEIFGHAPELYKALESFMKSPSPSLMAHRLNEIFAWLSSTEASGLDFLTQALSKTYDALQPLLSVFTQAGMDMTLPLDLFTDLAGNILDMMRQLVNTSDLLGPGVRHYVMFQQQVTGTNHTASRRHKREALLMPERQPMDDFIDLFYIDYSAMIKAISKPPTSPEVLETAHVFFANPDLNVVLNGVTSDMPWSLEAPREETITAALGVLSFLTHPSTFQMPSMDLLMQTVNLIPDEIPFSSVLKNFTQALANEPEENLILMQHTFATVSQLVQMSPTDPQFTPIFNQLISKVCKLEETESIRLVLQTLSLEPKQLCHTLLPSLQNLIESLTTNTTSLNDAFFQAIIGDPKTYQLQSNWGSALSQGLGFNTSSLRSLNVTVAPVGVVTVGEMLRNKTAFIADVQKHMDLDPAFLHTLLETPVPDNNLEILSWFVDLRHCNSEATKANDIISKILCSMSLKQWYNFSLLMARHVNMEKAIYRMVLSEEVQSLVRVLVQVAKVITKMMNTFLPAINQLQHYLVSVDDLNLVANSEFSEMTRGARRSLSSKATFVTLSRALCSNGIMALFGISKLPTVSELSPSTSDNAQREEMIERFKIPRTASPFCMNMYLDMVNTTGGAIAWAFLKPMLMGQILYSPDTPLTRSIMEKANATLQEFANLRKYSAEWIESSNYIVNSAQILGQTLPMLQNSLKNSFVKNFIEMQTDINVDKMKETLSNFSNMTLQLEKNKQVLKQITTLSTLMVQLSSCIKFDRYRGYDSVDELNDVAQDLAKNRDLYASVIFDLPEHENSSRTRHAKSSSDTSSLPPKVSYTIRMHMDNVMRTDRVRNPYFIKDSHISARMTMRYNRGFVYLQENIDRAIIETQAGYKVSEPAVQLQPFPYPCHLRDEYLEAISFVFPLMLMMAWLLFVADFVKKLVHERELRLHEYMKMMGVNPLSHFFAWFLECATYLLITIIILTLVLKYGNVLPKSDGFILFLYFCDYGLSILAFSYLISSFFDKTYIAGLSGSLIYVLCFFPFIVVKAVETSLSFSQKSALSLFSPTCFSYAGQYISRYESQGEGIHWNNSYTSPISGDTASFGWLCWLMLIDSILYFIIGAYIRMVFPGKYGIPAPWYFPFKASFWADLCCCFRPNRGGRGLLFTNIMHQNHPVFLDEKGKGHSAFSSQPDEDFSDLPVGVALHGLSKIYGERVAIQNLNVSFYQGHVTSLLGHNGAGKTTTMSLLTGLFAPSSGSIEVYGRDMQSNIDIIRRDLGVCMQYDVLFEHMTAKEHLLLYGQIKAPHWTKRELREQVRTILEETGMYAHRHKRVGALSGGMRRKLSISIAFIGGSRLVVLDEPTTGVDPCSRRSIWDIVIQHKKNRTIIMSTHHLDEAEVLSDRIAFLEQGGLKCCGSPLHLKDKLGQGYNLTLTRKIQSQHAENIDNAELKSFIQAHIPEARLKEAQRGDLVYSLPPFSSSNASSYRSLLTALDANLDALQLGGYGISDTTLEEVFLQLTQGATEEGDGPLSISETLSDSGSIDSFPSDLRGSFSSFGDKTKLTGSSTVSGMALAWQQMTAILIKRFHHSRRDWKGLITHIVLPVLFVAFAMGLGSIKSDRRHYPKLELSPELYKFEPSYSFFSNQNPSSSPLTDAMMSFPGIDNACLDQPHNRHCYKSANKWTSSGNSSNAFRECRCTSKDQICEVNTFQPPHETIPSSQIMYNVSGINVERYLVATANDFIRNRYGGFSFGMPLPPDLQLDLRAVPKNRTLSKVWFNPEGHHTMPAYLNSINNLILRTNLPADKDPRQYAISVSSHPYFGRNDDEDTIIQGMLQILVAMCVLTGYSITTASFAIYEVSEHHSGSKRLQHIAGISEPFYWAVNFFYDMVMYLIPVTLTIGVIAAFQIPAFTDRQNLGAITLLLVLFGFATFPWMYLLSGVFRDAEMAFITYVCINLFISINTILSTSILYFLSQISLRNPEVIQDIFQKLSHAFLIFPQFCFGNGLMQLARMDIEVQILSGYGVDAYKNPFTTESLGWMFIASFIEGLFFFTLRLLLNKFVIRKVSHLIYRRKKVLPVPLEDEDEDVAAEHQRVASGAASSDILQVNQLTKVYQHLSKKVHAVKRLSVGIPAGECFGLLGVNGAGKTTTFKMLTGDVSPTDGKAQIQDRDGRLVDIMECRNQGINIGYCPQVDALDDLLTGEEHLSFYGRIRGISKRELDAVVTYLLKRLELNYHKNTITDSYSCGTRRKLSTALALIGHPQILLLDEPSSGMDPRTKRHLWKIISEEVKGKCAVVLTSHSMEECEALCNRLAIMVKGQFRCLGSLQHIKNRFGSGFTVKMYLAGASCNTEAITSFMQRRFPSTYLKDQHSTMVEYHVPVAPGGVADIFTQLESNKNTLQIKHFSVSQTTLDEVFINFAMGNFGMEMENIPINSEDENDDPGSMKAVDA